MGRETASPTNDRIYTGNRITLSISVWPLKNPAFTGGDCARRPGSGLLHPTSKRLQCGAALFDLPPRCTDGGRHPCGNAGARHGTAGNEFALKPLKRRIQIPHPGPLICGDHGYPAGLMHQPDGRLHFVAVLPAGTSASKKGDTGVRFD